MLVEDSVDQLIQDNNEVLELLLVVDEELLDNVDRLNLDSNVVLEW